MRSRGEFIAIERLMREGSNSPYDNGVNGIFEACRTCHFHRPLMLLLAAYLISPPGLPIAAAWLLARVQDLLYAIMKAVA